LWIIGTHNTEARENLRTLKGRIVWDADKLDLIGFTGLSRYFHFVGERGNSIESIVELRKNRSEVNPYKFNTNNALILSESRIKTMKEFTRKYIEEILLLDYL